MILNYFVTTLRKFGKNKLLQFLNIAGLVFGITTFLLILLYVINESGFDSQHKNRNRIYRILMNYHPEGSDPNYNISFIQDETIQKLNNNYPEIEYAISIYQDDNTCEIIGDHYFSEENDVIFSESEIVKIFTYPLIKGEANDLLKEDFDALITSSKAKVFFPKCNPVGKILTYQSASDTFLIKIKGVIKDFPINSTLKSDFIIKISNQLKLNNYIYPQESYIMIKEGKSINELKKKLPTQKLDYGTIMIREYSLQPFEDIYFYSDHISYNPKPHGNINNLYILISVAIIILLVSVNNYIIFSIFNTKSILKDIAIRKSLGASTRDLRIQQMIRTSLFLIIAFFLSLILTYIIIPKWNTYFQVNLYPLFFSNIKFFFISIFIILIMIIICSSYINLYISKFNPLDLFHSSFISGRSKNYLQQGVVVFQLFLFVGLSSFSLSVKNQLNYAIKKDHGYNEENIICIDFSKEELSIFYRPFIEEIKKLPFIESISASSLPIPNSTMGKMHVPKYKNPDENVVLNHMFIENNFFKTFKIPVKNKDQISLLQKGYVINEHAAKLIGIPQSPKLPIMLTNPTGKTIQIESICSNFDIQNVESGIIPMVFHIKDRIFNYIYIRLSDKHPENAMAIIKSKYSEITKSETCEISSLSSTIKEIYHTEYKFLQALNFGTFLIILMAITGLVNVSLQSLRSKLKEITIRKIVGATEFSINKLLLKQQFTGLLIANITALLVSYTLINKWLQNFAQRIHITPELFIIPILFSILIVVLISIISVKIIYKGNLLDNLNNE
ncbi:MAG: ABC transporter permease [Bacteroidetes bacterium]|nr:ABC transporter permease [Bacteroidota bacterium]